MHVGMTHVAGFIDDTLRWVGNEVYMEFLLNENGRPVCA